jgi:hypothetical protein
LAIGLLSSAPHDCPADTSATYTNLTSGEILLFVRGSDNPPVAPRSANLTLTGFAVAGYAIACNPQTWSGDPPLVTCS